MRKAIYSEIPNERGNAEALGAFNASIGTGDIPTPNEQGFRKAPVGSLVESLNAKSGVGDFKFNLWEKGDMQRIYVNGGGLYNTGKVKQTAYIDAKTGNVSVFTASSQPMKWNISQSNQVKASLEKYGRYVRRFKQ